MADSYTDFGVGSDDLTSDQIDGIFDNFVLDYVSTADFYVTVTNGETKTTVATSDITVTTDPTLKVVISNPSTTYGIVASSLVRIGRTTGVASQERVFSDGSVLKASDLNTAFKQVLFGIQEQIDGGLGSIPTDTDGKLDAGGKVIKNVGAATNANDATTKDYVDNLVLVGAGIPQNWSFNLNDGGWTTSGNDLTRTLTDPVPTSANDNLYLVEVGGVLQDPDDAYSVTESSGTYTLMLVNAQSDLGSNVSVNLRNWGVTRNELLIPFKQETDDADSHALKVKNRSSTALGDLVHLLDHDDATLGKITKAGKLQVPEVSSVTGDLKVTSSVAVRNSDDSADVFKVDKDTGNTTVSGASAFTGTATFSGVLNAVGGLQKNGQTFMSLKSIVGMTGGMGQDNSGTVPANEYRYIGNSLKFVKDTTNYVEGDRILLFCSIPVRLAAEWVSLTIIKDDTVDEASRHNGDSYTKVAANNLFNTDPTRIIWPKSHVDFWYNHEDGTDAGFPVITTYGNHGNVITPFTVVYTLDADDAAKDQLTFDIVLLGGALGGGTSEIEYRGNYGSTFIGFLLG